MGELARRTRERQRAISSGHLRAASAGVLLVAVISFALGVAVGKGGTHREPARQSYLAAAADGALVEVLARVEATADPSGGADLLSFPDVLATELAEDLPEAAAEELEPGAASDPAADPMEAAVEEAGTEAVASPVVRVEEEGAAPPVAGVAPASGRYTIELGRFADYDAAAALESRLAGAESRVWMSVEIVDGQRRYVVAWGGYPDESAAAEARAKLDATGVVSTGIAEL